MFDSIFQNIFSVFVPRRALQSKVNAVAVYFPVDVLVNFNLIVLCDPDHCPQKPVVVMRRVSSSIKAAISQYSRFLFYPDAKNRAAAVGGYYVAEPNFDLLGMLSGGRADQLWMALMAQTTSHETGSDVAQWALVPVVSGSIPLVSDCDMINELTYCPVLSSSPALPTAAPPPSLDRSLANSTATTAEIPFPFPIPDLLDLVAVPTDTIGGTDVSVSAIGRDGSGHEAGSGSFSDNSPCNAGNSNVQSSSLESASQAPHPPDGMSPALDETYTVDAAPAVMPNASVGSALSLCVDSIANQTVSSLSAAAASTPAIPRNNMTVYPSQRRVTIATPNSQSLLGATNQAEGTTPIANPNMLTVTPTGTARNGIGTGIDSGIQVTTGDSSQSSQDSLQDFEIFRKRKAPVKSVTLFKTALLGKLTAQQTSALIRQKIGKKNNYFLALRGPCVSNLSLKIDDGLTVQLIRLIVKCNQLSGIYEVLRKAESTCWLQHPNKPKYSLFIGELSDFLVSAVIKFVRHRHGAPPVLTTLL
jgi:hypothetical protein